MLRRVTRRRLSLSWPSASPGEGRRSVSARWLAWRAAILAQLRDRAAQTLAYEFAARIQGEIGALSWVSCPQRVTTMDATNLTIAGWARGMLVQFLIRDGRLCSWSQRSCSSTDATDALAVTPAAWLEFTQRNAGMADRLTQHP